MMNEKIRFVLVGAVNTAVDFGVLFLLVSGFGIVPFVANIVSTTTALLTSFVLNKKAVFRNTDSRSIRQFVLFVVVTLAGIWGLQGIVILGVSQAALHLFTLQGTVVLLAAKIIATFFSLTWNYLWYSKVVFRKDEAHENK